MKVLIIEDEKLLADSIRSVLERKGFEAECVYDGENGAEYASGSCWPASMPCSGGRVPRWIS